LTKILPLYFLALFLLSVSPLCVDASRSLSITQKGRCYATLYNSLKRIFA
jgi:hypothetical protein